MNERPKWKYLPSSAGTGFGLVLILIALAAAIPRFWLGASQFIEYDGYWHVFIAQQDNWDRFWHDVYVNAHPPLYFLILKAVLHLGHSFLIYRSISLVTGVASVILTGLIARKVTGSGVRAWQSALAYGLALPGIIVSCEVRSYMLSVFFVLISFWYLLDTSGPASQPGEGKARTGFATGAVLACLSHYFAFFYSGAAMLLLISRFVVRKARGEVASWKAEIATSAPVAAVIVTLYIVHAGRLAQIQGHLLPYYFDTSGNETVTAFLIRNWKNFVNLFSPIQLSSGVALGVMVLGLIGAVVSIRSSRSAGRFPWTFPITAIMLAAIALAAVAGKYPFGGDLRQQFLLFPFVVLCGAIFVERVAVALARFVPRPGRLLLNSVAAAAIVFVSAAAFNQYPKISRGILADRMTLFDQLAPAPSGVYLDQFNLITFFIYHDGWRWTSVQPPQPIPGVDVYRLTRGRDQMFVFRDTDEWNIDPDDGAVYTKFAKCLRTEKIPDISVFSVQQSPPKPPLSDLRAVERNVVIRASESSVCLQRMTVNAVGWYATFRQSNCVPNVRIPQLTGPFDDGSPDIEYSGIWSHDPFPPAANGTLSFTNLAPSAASLTFKGTEVTWVYTKAFNRGIAEIKLDGKSQGEFDLYSPRIDWQTRAVFGNLAPGKHTLEIISTGRKRPEAADRYIDVDALLVR